MLEIRNLHISYGSIAAVKGVDITVAKGEIVAILGANGAGKTTLLRAITGLVNVNRGEIIFDGAPVTTVSPHRRVELGVAMAPEGRGIFPNLTVEENLSIGAYVYRKEKSNGMTREVMEGVFERFPILRKRRGQWAGTLSGGEQQMLSIGRALMSRPRLLLMDEPSMGLSPLLVKEIYRLVPSMREDGTTIVLVEQNAKAALKVVDRGYVLDMGLIACQGLAAELASSDEVCAAYLA